VCSDVLEILHQVHILNHYSLVIIFFVLIKHCFICVDVTTDAINRAYNDMADISEYFHLMRSVESFYQRKTLLFQYYFSTLLQIILNDYDIFSKFVSWAS
jgi:hypothetical protein